MKTQHNYQVEHKFTGHSNATIHKVQASNAREAFTKALGPEYRNEGTWQYKRDGRTVTRINTWSSHCIIFRA